MVDCRAGENSGSDECELLAHNERRWHVRASIALWTFTKGKFGVNAETSECFYGRGIGRDLKQ